MHIAHRTWADIQNDLAIPDKGLWNTGLLVDADSQIGRMTAIDAPFVKGAQKVGLLRQGVHVQTLSNAHLRMAFSIGVSASMKAGRVNRRSAYFNNGVACLGI